MPIAQGWACSNGIIRGTLHNISSLFFALMKQLPLQPLLLCSLLLALLNPPSFASNTDVNRQVEFSMATQAFQQENRYLAETLLKQLIDTGNAQEKQYFKALLLESKKQFSESKQLLNKLFMDNKEKPFAPHWVWDSFIEHLAKQRLAQNEQHRQAELQSILLHHFTALGGKHLIQSRNTSISYGSITSNGETKTFRIFRQRPNFYRMDLYTSDTRIINAFDGQAAWRLHILKNNISGNYLDKNENKALADNAFFDDVLIRFETTGEKLYYVGTEQLGKITAHRIEVDSPSSNHLYTIFLDTNSYLEVKRLVWEKQSNEPVAEVFLEYKQINGQNLIANKRIQRSGDTILYDFEKYDFGKTIKLSAFDLESTRNRQTRLQNQAPENPADNRTE